MDAIKCDPFCTSYDLAALVQKEHGLSVSLSTIARSRRALGFRYKLARRSQEHQRPPCNHPFLNNANVYTNAIAVDESSFVSNDTPRRGWAQGSQDVPKSAPRNRQRLTLILAITRNGVVGYQLHKGSFNAKLYAKFLETLPGHHRIIADNVSFHKSRCVRDAAEMRGQELTYTPPYCPWFNPTEFAFSVTKHAYRKSRWNGESDVEGSVLRALNTLAPANCESFFEHAQNCLQDEHRRYSA